MAVFMVMEPVTVKKHFGTKRAIYKSLFLLLFLKVT